jgi:hypothetical protein
MLCPSQNPVFYHPINIYRVSTTQTRILIMKYESVTFYLFVTARKKNVNRKKGLRKNDNDWKET